MTKKIQAGSNKIVQDIACVWPLFACPSKIPRIESTNQTEVKVGNSSF